MRWGIVGSEDLGNGMKALYHYEFNLASNNQGNGSTQDMENVRLANAGLQGSWGKVVIGRQWWPSYFTTFNKTDTADTHAIGASQGNLSGNRSGNLITYMAPDMGGFSIGGAILMDNDDSTYRSSDVDKYEITGQYKNGPMQIGAAYRDHDLGTVACTTNCLEQTAWGISGSYAFGDFSVEGGYYDFESETGGVSSDGDAWNLGGTYKMGNTHIHGAYRSSEYENAPGTPDTETTDWYIGVRHFMSKETRVFVEYRQLEVETGPTTTTDTDTFSFGLRKDWKL